MGTTSVESGPVQELLDRAAITELIYTVARAMDARDWDLLATCYAPEAVGDYSNATADGREAIIAGARAFLDPFDATQHLVGNVQITVDPDTRPGTATAHATFIAQHVRAEATGNGHYILGGDYDDNLRRTDEGWKITRRRIRGIWGDGDSSVLSIPVA
ncbi:nuclear transport factor 2 family protein [Streptomyces varsoviensis]|uniref:nuclear transport factor 2 family protein n=1 Tax=Streptomyces varsoviensis TaxID=67373 RepID=UPI0033C953C1